MEEHEEAFNNLNRCLIDKMTLAYPNPDKEYILSMNSSEFVIAGISSQKDENSVEGIITCTSKTLKATS